MATACVARLAARTFGWAMTAKAKGTVDVAMKNAFNPSARPSSLVAGRMIPMPILRLDS